MKVIEKTADLATVCASLRQAEFVTVDTEFMRSNTYWPKLCLVQLGGPDGAWAADPLSPDLSMEPFVELMADKSVLKVLHAARQDMEIFLHEYDALPSPVFDTQVAAMVAGFGESVGYETLVNHFTRARVDKSSRFTDWSRRPLTGKQVQYALGDVIHLREVYAGLAKILAKNGRESWLKEEMDTLTDPATYRVQPEDAWMKLKPKSSNRRFMAYVRALAEWREHRAQKIDVPRNRVIRDDVLLEIAAHPPASQDDLRSVRGLAENLARGAIGESLIAAVESARQLPDSKLPKIEKRKQLPRGIGPTVDLMRVLLKLRCEEEHVAQKLVANVADLEELAADDRADVPASHGWRHDLFGRDALALKHGKLALSIRDGNVAVTEIG
ncbi:MAG: ribonuclease D [Alphaproteobacteria bacterium]|nr:ribonuclease D [Alphaproteobacteria bacterium]